MTENSYLFGDAKATAKSVRRNGSQSELDAARVNYEASPGNPEAALVYAEALNAANLLEDAFAVYSEYLEIGSAKQDVLFEMALIAKSLGRAEESFGFFTKVVEMAPGTNIARSAQYEMWALDGKSEQRWAKK